MEEILKVEQISQTYQADNGELTALEDISFSVGKGEFVSIVGPSGCGKSTLLSIVAGMIRPTYGRVLLQGEPVEGISPHIGYMLQRIICWSGEISIKMWCWGWKSGKKLAGENVEYANSLLKAYGLWEFRDKYPSQLSGGMRQRAALIRTLAVKPDIFLLDEAFSALDYQTRLAVTDDVRRILKLEQKTTLMVTHDISESISMSDRIIVLSRRPAHISPDYGNSICRSGTDAAAAPRAAPVSGIFQYHMERA